MEVPNENPYAPCDPPCQFPQTDGSGHAFTSREGDERFRLLFREMPDPIFLVDLSGRLIDCNRAAEQGIGRSCADLIGTNLFADGLLVPVDVRARQQFRIDRIGEYLAGPIEFRVLRADGRTADWEVRGFRNVYRGEVSIVATARDVTQRKRVEQALRNSEENYRSIFNGTNEAIFIHDAETGRIVDVNQTMLDMYGVTREEALRAPPDQMSLGQPPFSATEAWELLRKAAHEGPQCFEWQSRRADGELFWVEVTLHRTTLGGKDRVMGVVRNIQARKQAEQRMRQMESQLAHVGRLSTMGEMVAGIAHEVSQPLYSVVNFAQAIQYTLENQTSVDTSQLGEWSTEILSAAGRAGEIIKRMRDFVRRAETPRESIDVHAVIRESLGFLAFEFNRCKVQPRCEFSADSSVVWADRVQIQQVMVNLLRNALEALHEVPELQRGVIVKTRHVGSLIEVLVADSGVGLPEDSALRIFDAFVTTKSKGLGMGLAISDSIVKAHGGQLWGDRSDSPLGATFRFTLPLQCSPSASGG